MFSFACDHGKAYILSMFSFASDGKAYNRSMFSFASDGKAYNRSMFSFAVIFIYFVRCVITL